MAANRWKEIWKGKKIVSDGSGEDEFARFIELKKANGFDVAVEDEKRYFEAFYNEWMAFYRKVSELTDNDLQSVYEVGCGSGVNLFLFQNRGVSEIGGCDYSDSMVESAKLATHAADLKCCGAIDIETEPKYDLVMAESVFQYFESEDYAETVLGKMLGKSKKLVYLGEIHDAAHKEELMEHRRSMIEDYDRKYEGLDKLFLRKDWLEGIAASYGRRVIYTPVNNPEYLNASYVFNCFIK